MNVDAEVRPALSAEEWRARKRPQYYRGQPCIALRGDGTLSISQDEKDGDDWTPRDSATVRDTKSRHALAALALHGQPFGFTREDVEALRAEGHPGADIYHPDELCCNRNLREARLRAIADRIAALLPPSENL